MFIGLCECLVIGMKYLNRLIIIKFHLKNIQVYLNSRKSMIIGSRVPFLQMLLNLIKLFEPN